MRELFGDLRKRGASTSGIKKLRAALSAMFATAVEDGLIRSNPVQGVRIPPAQERSRTSEPKALTRARLRRCSRSCPTEWRLFFEFLAHTGLRVSEAVGLTWEHVDLGSRPRVRVREQFYRGERKRLKSGHGRRDVPLSAGMAERLLALRRDSYRGEDAPVFATATGTELHASNVASGCSSRPRSRRAWASGQRRMADPVSWVAFHTFRHTCAACSSRTVRT